MAGFLTVSFPGLAAALLPFGKVAAPPLFYERSAIMRKLTKKELGATRTLAKTLIESGVSFEAAATIVGMRLTYLGAFSILNVEQVFKVER